MRDLQTPLIIIALGCLMGFFSVKTYAEQSNNQPSTQQQTKKEKGTKLYRVIDQNGNVAYSDQPSPGAKEIIVKDVPSINIKKTDIDFESLEEELEARRQVSPNYYQSIGFLELKEDSVVRNNSSAVPMTVSLVPELSKGHYIKFFIDGKLIGSRQKELSIVAQNIEYGTHTASFSIVSQESVEIQRSKPVKFHLLHVVRKKHG